MLGPSLKLESLEVDDATYPIRQYDPQKLVLRSGSEVGSCPFVYTYSTRLRSWIREGHILYGFKGKAGEASSEMTLTEFDGRVVLAEIEPEISFIDSLYIKVVDSGGLIRRILLPRDDLLRADDGKYLVRLMPRLAVEGTPIKGGARATRRSYY